MIPATPTVKLRRARSNAVMKILIVDGSREQRLHLVQVLGAVTNVVIQGAVEDMRSALHAVVEASPDVIVTGAALPDGDGAQLIEGVRALARTPSFVVVAGNQCEEQRARYLEVGVDRYVEKSDDSRAIQVAVTTLRRRPSTAAPQVEARGRICHERIGPAHEQRAHPRRQPPGLSLIHI